VFDPKANVIDWCAFDTEIARDLEPLCFAPDEKARRALAFKRMMAGEGGMSVAVTWDSRSRDYELWDESTVNELAEFLESFPVVSAFNHNFDVSVVSALAKRTLNLPEIVDPLSWIRDGNGRFMRGSRLSNLAEWNLGLPKEGNGKDAYELFASGQIAKLYRYCRGDVMRLRDLVYLARDQDSILGPNGLIQLDLPPWYKELA
jgi:hypothetical protein